MRKVATHDFQENDLPSTRVEIFFDTIKLRFGVLFRIGLLMFLFTLPLLMGTAFKDTYLYYLYNSLSSGKIDETQYNEIYMMTYRIFFLGEIPCFLLVALGLAGSFRVIRQLVWQEGIFFVKDFFDGIKNNAKHYLIYISIFGIFHYFARMAILLEINIPVIKYIPIIVLYVIFVPMILYNLIQSQIYTLNIGLEMKNGAILYIRTFFLVLIATLVAVLPIGFIFIPIVAVKIVAEISFILFIIPFILLGELLFFNSQFDKYINKNNYPEIYRKGLHEPKKTE